MTRQRRAAATREAALEAIILSIGTELTIGRTINTNAAWLSAELMKLGVATRAHMTIPDDHEHMVGAISAAVGTAQIVIVTGGLGPTADDFTRPAVSRAMKLDWQTDTEALERFRKLWTERTGRDLPDGSAGQFQWPVGAEKLANTTGVALGFIVRHKRLAKGVKGLPDAQGGALVVMPGVPVEMRTMFTDELEPRLRRLLPAGEMVHVRELMCAGMLEARLDEELRDLLEPGKDPEGAITLQESMGGIAIRFRTKGDAATAIPKLDAAEAEVRKRIGTVVYSDSGENQAQALAKLLADRQLTIALAESCTGGLATHFLSRVPGISEWLMQGVVTYSNQAKMDRLGVPAEILDSHGAVSEECARAMVEGIVKTANTNVGIAITGIAGPGGGTEDKPVGTVWLAASLNGTTVVKHHRRLGDRETIQNRAAWAALNLARELILGTA